MSFFIKKCIFEILIVTFLVSAQKYLAMMSNPDDAIRVINIRGGDITTTDTTMAKVTAPAKKSAGRH